MNVKLLAAVLASRGVSEEDLARRTGYTPATVAAYLAGRKRPSEAFAIAAEAVLKPKPGRLRSDPLATKDQST